MNSTSDWREDWSLGSIVRLREPYSAWVESDIEPWEHPYTHGMIVQHVGRGPLGTGRVSLHLYDPGAQRIYIGSNDIPTYVDFNCDELILHKDARKTGYELASFHDTDGYKGLAEAFND